VAATQKASLQLGGTYFKKGARLKNRRDFNGAVENYKKALVHIEQGNYDRLMVLANLNLGTSYRNLRKDQESLVCFEDALYISRKNGFKALEAKALQESGLIYSYLGQHEKALTRLEDALMLHKEIDDRKGEALDYITIGVIESKRMPALAGIYFQRALDISGEIGGPIITFRASGFLSRWQEKMAETSISDKSPSSTEIHHF
jgi:tetratricopeptide (TPR) repeat protein